MPQENVFQDNSAAYAYNPATGGTTSSLQQGDYIIGILNIGENTSRPAGQQTIDFQLDAVFAFKIATVDGPSYYSQVPASDIGFALTAAPGELAAILPGFSGIGASDAFALAEAPEGNVNVTTETAANAFADLNSGKYMLDATGALVGQNDYLQAALSPTFLTAPPSANIGSEAGGLTFTSAQVDFSPGVSGADLNGNSTFNGLYFSTSLLGRSAAQAANGWLIADQSTLAMNVVPEPSSCALLCAFFGILSLLGAFRRGRVALRTVSCPGLRTCVINVFVS